MRIIILFALLLATLFIGCESTTESPVEMTAGAPAAPPSAPDNHWTAHNLRIKSWDDTATHIVVWLSYERNGTQTVSTKIKIEK